MKLELTNLSIKDNRRRKLFSRFEMTRKILKSIFYNRSLSWEYRENARILLCGLPRDSSITRPKNRCVITGRGKGILRKFRISRIVFREQGVKGGLVGIKKEGNN